MNRPNHLIHETSPYLLMHAYNPVDWYAWGPEALNKAEAEDKPIFLSIGYSACHWCHRLREESFEDPATAALMNQLFINIKVDREERPDLDSIYMNAVVALTGQGGWPMSVFLTPDGIPFYGGTYFPPTPRHGLPSFTQLLQGIHEAWVNRREEVLQGGREVLAHIRQEMAVGGAEELSRETLQAAVKALWSQFDWRDAGWGRAPKFPQPMTIEFLLRAHTLTGEATPLEMAVKTLQAMARGGVYDQLGGGFHRYSTDALWLVPHFEKMLYDNAQLARVYLHAWQLTGEAEFRRVAEETLDYVRREMTDSAGGFYSSQDADSEGEEGKFFVWAAQEIDARLGAAGASSPPARADARPDGAFGAEAALFKEAYGVRPGGNFEGGNILHLTAEAPERLSAARRILFEAREQRVKPGLDDKVLAAWNGLMLAALAEAARVLNRADYLQAAIANADFLLAQMRQADGRLYRSWRRGTASLNAYLEDYANAADGLLAVYEATFDARYFIAARELVDFALAHFTDAQGGFFDTSDDHETLVTRPKDVQDNATPSGSAMLVTVLLKLAALTGDEHYAQVAETSLRSIQPVLARYPTGFAQWLTALSFALGQPKEIALIGDATQSDTQALLEVVFGQYRPFKVVALKRPGEASPVPLLEGREQRAGRATAAVCYNFACRLPVTSAEELEAQLNGMS